MAVYNLYTRFLGAEDGMEHVIDPACQEEITVFNSMGSQDPMTVFLDDGWRLNNSRPIPPNLKMLRTDHQDKDQAGMLAKFSGLERFYLVSRRINSKSSSTAATPTTPSTATPGVTNGTTSAYGTPTITESQCRSIGGEYLAVIQSHHRTMRHLLLPDRWVISDSALYKLCQSCPHLEQLGFSCNVPPLESLRQIIALCPKLWAIRMLVRPGSELAETVAAMDPEMHGFALATEFWRPEYRNVKYVGLGDKLVYKLGGITFPPKNAPPIPEGQQNSMNAKRAGPMRRIEVLDRDKVKWIEIWGLDTTEFDPKFP
jgi:hypothetical protein